MPTVVQLRAALKERGLPTSGRKADLERRLGEAVSEEREGGGYRSRVELQPRAASKAFWTATPPEPTAEAKSRADRRARPKVHYIAIKQLLAEEKERIHEFISKHTAQETEANTKIRYETRHQGDLYHKFEIRAVETLPGKEWGGRNIKFAITWQVDNSYPVYYLAVLRWFGDKNVLHRFANRDGTVFIAVRLTFNTRYMACEFIRYLDKFMETRGPTSANDADATAGVAVLTWGKCNSADKEAYIELTKDFDSQNALTYEGSEAPAVCRFSYYGNQEPPGVARLVVQKVKAAKISWVGSLAFELAIYRFSKDEWQIGARSGPAGDGPRIRNPKPCVGLLRLKGHHAVLYCPATHPNGEAEDWFYVDPWRQPPLTGKLMEEFQQLKDAWPKNITHLSAARMQLPTEPSCTAVALMKAFAIANSIHVVNQQSEDPPTEVSGGESAMEIYHRKCSKVHRVATGKLEDGTNDPGWLRNNVCFAKLAHRLVRITEPKKWQPKWVSLYPPAPVTDVP